MPWTDEKMTALMAGSERRKFKRTLFRSHAELLVYNCSPVEVRTVDISGGGVGVVGPLNFPPGTRCEIHLHFRKIPFGMENIAVQAEIVHCVLSGKEQGFLMGLQFVDPAPATLNAIDRYIRSIPNIW